MRGWLRLYRELLDKPIWKNSTLEQRTILITLLCFANHQSNEWEFKNEIFEVQPGQFITSVQSIIEKCNCKEITRQKVRTALTRFEKFGFLTIETTKQNSLVTIVNWEKYQCFDNDDNQATDQELTNAQPTDNHHVTTNNNDDKVNKGKKERNINSTPVRHKYGLYGNVLLSDEDIEKLKTEFPNDYLTRIENLSAYIASTGKSYKNHLATIRNWAAKDLVRTAESYRGKAQPQQNVQDSFLSAARRIEERKQKEGNNIVN